MTLQVALQEAVSQVCPILGISFGRLDNKATWRIDYEEEATEGQKEAARQVLANFVWDDTAKERERKAGRDRQYSSDMMYRYQYQQYALSHLGATFSQFMDHLESIVL